MYCSWEVRTLEKKLKEGLSQFLKRSLSSQEESARLQVWKYEIVWGSLVFGVWKKLKQKMDERHIKRCPNIGHEKSKH
jgi:hypothetical protein